MRLGRGTPITASRTVAALLAAAVAFVIIGLPGCERSSAPDEGMKVPQGSDSSSRPEAAAQQPAQVESEPEDQLVGEQRGAAPHVTPASPPSGPELYARHCAACHGERGDGKGVAAAFLFPKPRDFQAGRFRLVSTRNNVPTRDDLQAVLLRGMPGSAMPPWAHLSQQERDALVDEILRLRREGARELYIRLLREQEELTDEEIAADDVQEEIQEYVDDFTTPGETTDAPAFGPPTPESIARGKRVYAKFVCISCHGETGRGDGVQEMWDDEKMPTRPRDFTFGIFKGNDAPASLYRRIAYGMPGTPMPGSSTMRPEQMVDLVHYIRSMSTEEQRQAAVLNRDTIVVRSVDTVPADPKARVWTEIRPISIRMAPLWWRDNADPDLQVQAVHDDKKMAVRISWKDEGRDGHAVKSESFEDAVAMELYRGDAEPFLGMGSGDQSVDVWFWDADRQSAIDVEDQYPRVVDDIYPFSEKAVETAEYARSGTSSAEQPKVSLPAVASGNQIVPSGAASGGSDLAAGGPGSVTFRLPMSQLVIALGQWKDGRWTVVMTRSLEVESPDEGVSLEPGGKASVAFAVWDGSFQDRDGKKSITVWQDLEIEP